MLECVTVTLRIERFFFKYFTNKLDRKCMYNVTVWRFFSIIFSVESNKYIIFWECVNIDLVIQHAMRILRTAIRGLCGSTLSISTFPHYPIKGKILEKLFLSMKCVFGFSLYLSKTFLILRKTERNMTINVYWPLCKVILVRF